MQIRGPSVKRESQIMYGLWEASQSRLRGRGNNSRDGSRGKSHRSVEGQEDAHRKARLFQSTE